MLLNVGLCGGVVLSLQALATGKGPMVAYERALAVRRKVWFSEAFHAIHPGLMHTFLARLADVAAGPVRWGIISQRDEFIRQLRRNRRGGLAFVALVAKTEVTIRTCAVRNASRPRRLPASSQCSGNIGGGGELTSRRLAAALAAECPRRAPL